MASTPTTPDETAAPFGGYGVPAAPAFDGDAAEAEEAGARLLLFGVHGRVYACEIGEVREIIPFRRITRLPGAPAHVLGLINLRGSVVTVLDLGVRLAGAPVDRTLGSIVLVEAGAKVVGLGVSDVRDVQRVPAGAVGADAEGADGALVRGLVHVTTVDHAASSAGTSSNGAYGGGAAGDPAGAAQVRDVEGSVVVLLDVQAVIKQALL